MSNQINEILTHFIDVIEGRAFPCLSLNQIKLLLSYITNLQKENNNLKEDFKRHIDRINELTERNDHLQEENERLLVELNQNMIERNNYLSINEKAIEILKEYENDKEANRYAPIKETINILQGSEENGNE